MKTNKSIRRFFLAICLIAGIGILSPCFGIKAKAASGYKPILDVNKKIVKDGKYYFKSGSSYGSLLMSTKKNSGYRKTPIWGYGAYGNGKQAFYVRNGLLCKYTYASRKETILKRLSVTDDIGFNISTVYGNQIFLTKSSFYQWKHWTYSYNIKTKKFRLAASKCDIIGRSGKYVIGQNEYRTDVSPYPITLYKITSSGLSKVKKITNRGMSGTFTGKKLYYVQYPNRSSMKTATLYCCNLNGSNKKAIRTFKSSSQYGQTLIYNITSKSCDVSKDEALYRYTYSTKKMKKLR